MANSPWLTFPLFDDNPNEQFEFVAITDINMHEYPYFFKAVFRNIDTNEEIYVDNIYPEAMKQCYFIGHIYRNKKFIRIAANVKTREFKLNNNACSVLQKISDVITKEDIRLINHDIAYTDFINQYAHIEIKKNYVLIIPCSLIAVQFYLLYGEMKKAAMTGRLESLYYFDSFKSNVLDNGTKEAYIEVKSYVALRHRRDLIRLINSSYTQNRFHYIFASKYKYKAYQPIRCNLPVDRSFKAKLSYIQIGTVNGEKPKYLALHMYSNDTHYDFDQATCMFF